MAVRRALVFIGLALLALMGLRGLALHLPGGIARDAYVAAAATIPGWIKALVWFVAVALPAGLLAMAIWGRHDQKILTLEGRDGGQMVLRQAVIVKVVRGSVAELPQIDRLAVSARNRPNGLRVEIGVKAKAVASVRELEEAIRRRVDDSLRRILGIQAIDGIFIRLDDISLSDRVMPLREPPAQAPLPPPRAPLADKMEPRPETLGQAPPSPPGETREPPAPQSREEPRFETPAEEAWKIPPTAEPGPEEETRGNGKENP